MAVRNQIRGYYQMDQIKKAGEVAQQDSQDLELDKAAKEIRTLQDLEMVLVGGGECVTCW